MSMQHKTDIPPVFLSYARVCTAGEHLPLVQIAKAAINALGRDGVLDAVQPIKMGWYIYMCTNTDRSELVCKGMTVAGKHVMLRNEMNPAQRNTIKMTVKDLPLHSVSNQDVLDAVKEYCPVYSEVKYSNIWHNGKATSICNGDRFLYISQSDLAKIPELLDVSTYKARVFKPLALTKCKRCSAEGHRPSDLNVL